MNSDSKSTVGLSATSDPDSPLEPASDEITALASRRLTQIVTTLGLEAKHFICVQAEAKRALGHDQTLADQHRQLTDALRQFVDPLVRTRAVELFVTLARSDAASTPK